MKKYGLLFAFLFTIGNCLAQDQMQAFFGNTKPHKQKLGDLATIVFAAKPEERFPETGGVIYRLDHGGKVYIAQIAKERKNLQERFTSHITDTIYNSYSRSVMRVLHGKVFYKKDTILNGLPGMAFAYRAIIDSTVCYNYHYVTYTGEHIIGSAVWSADSLSWKDTTITKFFSSLTSTAKGKKIRDQEIAEGDIDTGRIVLVSGSVISGIILLLVIIVLIRNRNQNR